MWCTTTLWRVSERGVCGRVLHVGVGGVWSQCEEGVPRCTAPPPPTPNTTTHHAQTHTHTHTHTLGGDDDPYLLSWRGLDAQAYYQQVSAKR